VQLDEKRKFSSRATAVIPVLPVPGTVLQHDSAVSIMIHDLFYRYHRLQVCVRVPDAYPVRMCMCMWSTDTSGSRWACHFRASFQSASPPLGKASLASSGQPWGNLDFLCCLAGTNTACHHRIAQPQGRYSPKGLFIKNKTGHWIHTATQPAGRPKSSP
jgi:hypothetical protein